MSNRNSVKAMVLKNETKRGENGVKRWINKRNEGNKSMLTDM